MGTGRGSVLCGREGNRRSGVALTIRHILWYIYLRAQWPKQGKGQPRLHSSTEYGTLYLYLQQTVKVLSSS